MKCPLSAAIFIFRVVMPGLFESFVSPVFSIYLSALLSALSYYLIFSGLELICLFVCLLVCLFICPFICPFTFHYISPFSLSSCSPMASALLISSLFAVYESPKRYMVVLFCPSVFKRPLDLSISRYLLICFSERCGPIILTMSERLALPYFCRKGRITAQT